MGRIGVNSPEVSPGRAGNLVRLAIQYTKFGAVGLAATATHSAAFALLIEVFGLMPLAANAAAFGLATLLSFFGHRHWTFRADAGNGNVPRRGVAITVLTRFVIVAVIGLALNSAVVYIVVHLLFLPYTYAIPLMIFVVPVVTFGFYKFWAFA